MHPCLEVIGFRLSFGIDSSACVHRLSASLVSIVYIEHAVEFPNPGHCLHCMLKEPIVTPNCSCQMCYHSSHDCDVECTEAILYNVKSYSQLIISV